MEIIDEGCETVEGVWGKLGGWITPPKLMGMVELRGGILALSIFLLTLNLN